MEIEQIAAAPVAANPAAQQTLTARFFRCIFTTIFYLQLILNSAFVVFLMLRGLVFTNSPNFHPKKWYTPLLSSVAVSGALSLAWQCFLSCNIAATVKATFFLTPFLIFSIGIFQIVSTPNVVRWISIVFFIVGLAHAAYCWLYVRGSQRNFTITIMARSTALLPPRTRLIAVVSVILSVFYSGFLVAGIGGATATRTRLDILFISIVMINLAWTMQVLKNIQEVAISKARYVYFKRHELMNACDALGATMRNQLGNVCIGSTLLPIYVPIRCTIRTCNMMDDESDRTMYASNVDCCWIANHLVLHGNRYGFVHVGAYNKSFVQASTDTWQRFRATVGLEEIIDSDITSSVCFLSAISIGAISALTAGIWEFYIHKDYYFQQTLYAFIIGYFVGRVASAWLQGCVLAYYVAYSEDPQSDIFDDTIPKRIVRQNIEEQKRLASYEPRRQEDEPEPTYAS
ncbi:unnamed protein product [Microthlaspi erraticum]|uniref:Choline transporter-like protein n=1 Tax=Microthlaspi erraticum TaxID=1685480 RepID=A0A6D2L6R6_9BRAS|nr:unnamed protein product [Microthlaspi erraticum]